jgi:DNA-directed RNA polymerase subunit beta
MSTEDKDSLMPAQLVNFRPIAAVIKEFFASSQLSQFMDQVNPLAELEHKRRISRSVPAASPASARASRYATCTVRTTAASVRSKRPEGSNIGLINYLASYTRINDFGFLEAPYAKW